eukprot:tig00001065_g6743.t1
MAEIAIVGGLAAAGGAAYVAAGVARAQHNKKVEQALHKPYDFFATRHPLKAPETEEERRKEARMQMIGRWACCLPLPCLAGLAHLATKAGGGRAIDAALKPRGGPRIALKAVRLQAEEGLTTMEGHIALTEIRQELTLKNLKLAAKGKGVPPIVDEGDERLRKKKAQIALRNIRIQDIQFQRPLTDQEGDSFRVIVTGLSFRAETDFALENLPLGLGAVFDEARTGRARITASSGMLFIDGCLDPEAKKLQVRCSFAPLQVALEHSNKVVQSTVNKLVELLEPSIRAKLQHDVQRHVGRAVGRLVSFAVQTDAEVTPGQLQAAIASK